MSKQIVSRTVKSDAASVISTDEPTRAGVLSRQEVKAITARRRSSSGLLTGLIYVFLTIMALFALFPLYYVAQASLAGAQNLYTTDLHLLPVHPTLDNYVYAFTQEPILYWLANTTFVCGLATAIGLIFSMTGAYALSRFRMRGRELSLNLLLTIQAFPGLLAITAYYYLLQYLNLLNTAPLLGLALIYAAGNIVFGTWNIKGYFDTLPVELEQAAMVDGASHLQAFIRVVLPLAAPALATTALLTFVSGWNEFPLANYVISGNPQGTDLTFILGLFQLQGNFRTPWGYFAATSIIISVPLMVVFLYAQRYFQSGLTIGSVKG
jgi:arabinogalactan oligomer/maltooligosaccharide transport system permease protein